MADFCHGCTLEMTGEPEYARRNDMVGCDGAWALCECCGLHRFTNEGRRFCKRHPAEDEVSADACERCAELIA